MTEPPDRPLGREDAWDRFIDALDRAGQAGSPAGVVVPSFASGGLAGKQFGDLSRVDAKQLAHVAAALGRNAQTVVTIWEDMQRRRRPPAAKKPRRSPRS
jgi:hypothetical protein